MAKDDRTSRSLNILPPDYYTPFLSELARNRKPSPIRSLFPLENRPGVLSLLAGKPNPTAFPITSVKLTAHGGASDSSSTLASAAEAPIEVTLDGPVLAAALQYGPTTGMPPLVSWLGKLQEEVHGRREGEGWRVSIGTGSQDLLYKAFHTLVNPGDPVLVESPVYAGILPILHDLKAEIIDIPTDAEGIQTLHLRHVLENWPVGKRKPRMLYTVPYGGNPSGITASSARRREGLALAHEHDFLILEDDPYFYLYFGDAPRPPSYFSLEREQSLAGRVIRFDSLSKILSAGIRIGFVSGPERILNAIDAHTAISNLQSSSLTQALTHSLLSAWGTQGFAAHTQRAATLYRAKRDVFQAAMEKHLSGLAEWVVPEAGLFFWFKLYLPKSEEGAEGDSEALICGKALEKGVLALPGTVFMADGRKSAYVRAAFSLLEPEQVDEALKRLQDVILEVRSA